MKDRESERNGQDEQYRQLAERYVEEHGAQLRREMENLPPRETPLLDARVKRRTTQRRRNIAAGIGSLAAVLLLALILPRALRTISPGSLTPASPDAAAEGEHPAAPDDPAEYEIIPLGFTLPGNFTVASVEQDRAETIYHLGNDARDDVVLTLERGAQPDADALHEIDVNGRAVYGAYRADYSVLTFEEGGVRYEMTCRHDLNTLIELSRSILV